MCVGGGEYGYKKIPAVLSMLVLFLFSTEQAGAAVVSRRIQDAAGLNPGLPSTDSVVVFFPFPVYFISSIPPHMT
jgi:hypothetical protein